MSGAVAAIDCGTNTVRLLVVDGEGVELTRDVTITRLGEGVDATGRLSDEAMARTAGAIAGYVKRARSLGALEVAIVATSAARDASNRSSFVEAVREASGLEPMVVSGEVEAQLSFAGAMSGRSVDGPVSVVDVGGGSTEVIAGSGSHVERWVSMQLGSVRCAERFGLLGRVTDDRLRDVDAALDAEARGALEGWPSAVELIAVAATATSLAAMDAGLADYDAAVVHGRLVAEDAIVALRRELASLDGETRLVRFRVLQPGREDVIVAGTSVLLAVMRALGVTRIRASESDILDGIAAALLEDRPIVG